MYSRQTADSDVLPAEVVIPLEQRSRRAQWPVLILRYDPRRPDNFSYPGCQKNLFCYISRVLIFQSADWGLKPTFSQYGHTYSSISVCDDR